MKKLVIMSLAVVGLYACNTQPAENTTEAVVNENLSFYGDTITVSDAIGGAQMLAKLESVDSMQVKVEAVINKTCAMKGCWMTVDLGEGDPMRVSFKDYAFFVPKEGAEGKKVVFEGMVKKSVTSMDELKHYAKDAGEPQEVIDQITADKAELSFVATGVVIEETTL